MSTLGSVSWPSRRLGEALEELAREARLEPRNVTPPALPLSVARDPRELARWMVGAGEWLGIEVEEVSAPYAELRDAVVLSAPALWRIDGIDHEGLSRFVVVAKASRSTLTLLTPDATRIDVTPEVLRRALAAHDEAEVAPFAAHVLEAAGLDPEKQSKAAQKLLTAMIGNRAIAGGFTVGLSAGAPMLSHMRRARLFPRLLGLLACHLVLYGLSLAAWTMIGKAALDGRYDPAWLSAWALLVLAAIPLGMMSGWMQGRFGMGVSLLMKQRLLTGALRLPPEQVRSEGSGQILSRVIEAEAIEGLLTSGGFTTLVGIIELLLLPALLWRGAAGPAHVVLLFAFVLTIGVVAFVVARRRLAWTDVRLALTRDLVERMNGHRTRLAQQAPERWHEGEDEAVERYLTSSAAQDRSNILMSALASRGFVVFSVMMLIPRLLEGPVALPALALALGGTLLAQQALAKWAGGLVALSDAWISWRVAGPVYRAAKNEGPTGTPGLALDDDRTDAGPVLSCRQIVYRHAGRGEPVLKGCTFDLQRGDRVLLEGPSGGGKSTLAAILTGLRIPQSGLVLLHGLDRFSLGADVWRRHVAFAPQFHENHVLTGSLAFNLLMGREWPASPEMLGEAQALMVDLGLGDLLARMPSGLEQMVGESGWQLSHGERSRLFAARAILQGGEVVILDESFGALDPENLERALSTVMARAQTLVVIAHP